MRARGALAVMGAALVLLATGCPTPPTGGGDPVPVGSLSRITSYTWPTDTSFISGDGQWVFYVTEDGNDNEGALHLWNRATSQDVAITDASKRTRPLGLSTDGRYSTFSRDEGSGQWSVNSYDRTTGTTTTVPSATINGDSVVRTSASGAVLYAVNDGTNSVVHRWTPSTGIDETVLTGSNFLLPLAMSPDGNSAVYILFGSDLATSGDGLYAGPVGGPLSLVVNGQLDEQHPFATPFFASNVAISNSGDVIYTRFTEGSENYIIASGVIRLWSAADATTVDLVAPAGRVAATTGISGDGRYISYLNLPAPLNTGDFDGSEGKFPAGGRIERLDRQSATSILMTYGRVGIGELAVSALSDDGNSAVIASNDPSGDDNGELMDLFLWANT